MTNKRRIGVYVCHCGGNISDHVNVKEVADTLAKGIRSRGHADASVRLFGCFATGNDREIKEKKLDGLVIASCSRNFTCSRSAPWRNAPD